MNILVLHGLLENSRNTNIKHIKAFGQHANGHRVYYLNIFSPKVFSLPIDFDLMIVGYEVFSYRTTELWREITFRLQKLIKSAKSSAAITQDEYTYSKRLDDIISNLRFDYVFTPIEKNLEDIFPKSIRKGIPISTILTGYASEMSNHEIDEINRDFWLRPIDLGQRVRQLPLEFGAGGQQKAKLAIQFAELAKINGFSVDVSSSPSQELLGTNWVKFLRAIRFTISRRGGASIADRKNKLAKRLRLFSTVAPGLPGSVLEKVVKSSNVFFGDYSSVSPRLFEAAESGVCQILESDEYLPGFLPWVHYLPINSDFSNVDQIFKFMRDQSEVEKIVKNSQDFLILSGNYSYQSFVGNILEKLGQKVLKSEPVTVIDLDMETDDWTKLEMNLRQIGSFWINRKYSFFWRKELSALTNSSLSHEYLRYNSFEMDLEVSRQLEISRIAIIQSPFSIQLMQYEWRPALSF